MKFIHEWPSRRRYPRVTESLDVTLPDGRIISATNWCLGGLRLDLTLDPLPSTGERMELDLKLPFGGFFVCFAVSAIVRWSDHGALGVEFEALFEGQHNLMSRVIDDLVCEQTASGEGAICQRSGSLWHECTSSAPHWLDRPSESVWRTWRG